MGDLGPFLLFRSKIKTTANKIYKFAPFLVWCGFKKGYAQKYALFIKKWPGFLRA